MRYTEMLRGARRRVRELDRTTGIPRPMDVTLLVERLEHVRGRPIELFATTCRTGGPMGMWVCRPDRDIIVYPADTSPLHQAHIVLHEIGHMIAEHRRDCSLPADVATRLTSLVGPALIQHMMGRTTYATPEEWEAEIIASHIWSTATLGRPSAPSQAGSGPAPQLAWIEQSCGL